MEALINSDSLILKNVSPTLYVKSDNLSGSTGKLPESLPYNRHIRIISMTVIFTVAIVGNLVVLHKICSRKNKKRKIDFLITNLAVADLCVSLLTLLSQIVWEVLEDTWLAGDVACRLFKVFQVFGLIASSNIIAVIAVERHHVILNPLDSALPTRRLTVAAWITALLLSIPQAFVFKAVRIENDNSRCLNTFGDLPRWHFQLYIIFGATTVFFAPFCILCVTYSRILWTIWRKEQNVEILKPAKNADYLTRPTMIVATNSSIPKAKVKTLKMTLVIIILFIICGLPYFIIEMKLAFGNIGKTEDVVVAVLGIFVVSNSAVNPYVYLFFRSNNRYTRKVEKNVCFWCLRDSQECTLHREPFVYRGKKDLTTATSTSDVDSSQC
ncbi:probable G-protein coupled receptor 150 [Protopterus annectens]|uniref:probable G-protein coupled receptor 150 n=1 Tax=Protopterus annectens TaxID=7888 RepID=UPI001CFAB080|nr:probable G-protein coupled receptor 150 [Protopterus annectens]